MASQPFSAAPVRGARYAVIGAGSSGLAAAKALMEYGFEVDVLERERELGGNWNFGKPNARVYASTHMISSKPFTSYPDYPMPDRFPDYAHHTQVLEYLRSYAGHFGVDDRIEFGVSVERMEPLGAAPDSGWSVRTTSGQERAYAGVIVANGHNWFPKTPEYPGVFSGEIMHSAQYRDPSVLRGRRVLIVGAGNTGCDIAVEAAQNASRTFHSMRRGYWYAQKYTFGRPSDQIYDALLSLNLPVPVLRFLLETTAKLTVGDLRKYGLPKPDHKFLETHPVVNSLLVYYAGHGDLVPKPDIERFEGDRVHFRDGSSEAIDLLLYCTGYLIKFPFLADRYLNLEGGRPVLYKNVFHPERNDLFVSGLIQPDSGQFKLVHWQGVGIARYLKARVESPQAARAFEAKKRARAGETQSGGIAYKESTRHLVEVNHMRYLEGFERDVVNALPVCTRSGRGPFPERVMQRLDWSFPVSTPSLEVIVRSSAQSAHRPPVLFVHGLAHGAWCWEHRWMPELARRGWTCGAVSLRGHGQSEGKHGSFRAYAHDVMEAITRMERAPILVGHSMGAGVLQRVCEHYAAPLSVLLTPIGPSGSMLASLGYAVRHPVGFVRVLMNGAPSLTAAEMFGSHPPEDATELLERVQAPGRGNVIRIAGRRRPRPARGPVVVVGALQDRIVPKREVAACGRHYGTEVHWWDDGHMVMTSGRWKENLDAFEGILLGAADERPQLRAVSA